MRRARTRKFINKGLQRKLIAVFVGVATYYSLFQVYLLNRSLVHMADGVGAGPEVLDGLPTIVQDNLAITLYVLVPTMWAFGVIVTHRIAGPLYRLEQHLAAIAAGGDPGPCNLRKFVELCETMNAAGDRPLPAPNRELAPANDQILAAFLAKLQGDDLVTRVKKAIANELPSGSPSEEFIAKAVYMSPRSLRRLLSSASTTYSQLLDAVRRELAEQYLANSAESLTEIAFLLGFSELSAFSRAFARWTGQSPSAFREALSI